ncbi:DUF4070 domain-containing protein [Candidatus Woesearchaeota archaeon]|nr:DUF4070 domain-containing protein [Candidatus Woesearchaeota archaeon]
MHTKKEFQDKNILMVYPKYPDTFWSFKHVLKFISKKAAFPPLGLMTVSSMLPKNWNKRLIDLNIKNLSEKDILWADFVFISAMIVQKDSAQEIINLCNKLGKTVIAGGPVFTTGHEKFTGVDHYILNEAEITLPLFLEDLKKGELKKIYSSYDRPDITKVPVPDWKLINMKKYATMPVQYSRGCPFDCEFCDIIIMNGRTPRTKTPSQFVAEFQALYNAGWRGGIFVVDDNFIGNKLNVKKMLTELIDWQKKHKYPFQLLTEASVNLADDEELMNLMTEANFSKVFLGIETPDADSLNECSKTQNATRSVDLAVKKIHNHGLQVMAGFIVGFDNDKDNIFERQIEFIQKTGVVTAMVGVLQALPKTRLWQRLKEEGRLLKDSHGENTSAYLNFIPKMDPAKLIEGYKKILSTIYSPKEYYERIQVLIDDYVPKFKAKFKFMDLKPLFRSFWRIGIVSKARKYYWKLMLKTMFTKHRALPLVIELAIYGLHFEKVSRFANT